jgi:predicted transcriptional regulator
MARPIRIEFEGALYHILSMGNERRDVLLYYLRETGLYTNRQIGELFGLTYSAVSRHANIVKTKIAKQPEMKQKHSLIKSRIKV